MRTSRFDVIRCRWFYGTYQRSQVGSQTFEPEQKRSVGRIPGKEQLLGTGAEWRDRRWPA